MTTLLNIVQRIGGTDASAILASLLVTVTTQTDSTLKGYVWVARMYGDQAAESLLAAINGAGLPGAAMAYVSVGFDLSDPLTQAKLDAIAAQVPGLATLCGQLKAVGIQTAPQWQAYGLESAPVLADVESAIAHLASRQEVVTFLNEYFNPLVAQDTVTKSQVQALVAAWGN